MALTLLTLAASGDRHWDGPWWVFPPLFFLIWVAVIVTVFWLFGRRWRGGWRDDGGFGAGARVLAERFARGEITEAEYNERLGQLRRAVDGQRR